MSTPRFVGSKKGGALPFAILNLIPPHAVFIEPFAGLAAITRRKKPAAETILVDKRRDSRLELPAGVRFVRGCGITFLRNYPWIGIEFVYCDPPYLLSSRNNRVYYAEEFTTAEHVELLRVLLWLTGLGVRVLLSGYHSTLYAETLSGWNLHKVQTYTQTHQVRTECLWFNYPRPTVLHEYGATGEGWRERQRIKRKVHRWAERLRAQGPLERAALFSALVDVMGAGAVRTAINEAAAAHGVSGVQVLPAPHAGSVVPSSSGPARRKRGGDIDLATTPETAGLEEKLRG